jgi:hypothetical protein
MHEVVAGQYEIRVLEENRVVKIQQAAPINRLHTLIYCRIVRELVVLFVVN